MGSMNSICPQCLQHKLQFRIKVLLGRVLGGRAACPGYHLLLLVEVFRNQKSVVFVSTSWLRHKYEPEYLNLLWNARSILRRGITNNHTCFVHVSKHTFEHHSLPPCSPIEVMNLQTAACMHVCRIQSSENLISNH